MSQSADLSLNLDDWLPKRLAPPLLACCSVEMIPWESLSVHTDETSVSPDRRTKRNAR